MTNPNSRIIIQEFGFVLLVHAVFIKLGVKGVEIPAVELVGYPAQSFAEIGGLSERKIVDYNFRFLSRNA